MIRVDASELILKKQSLLRELDDIEKQIDKKVQQAINESEVTKMANEEEVETQGTVEQEKPHLTIAERFEKVSALIATGKKNSEIAKEVGCSTAYVYNVRIGKTVFKDRKVKEPKAKKVKK